jgi:hypothetical protein
MSNKVIKEDVFDNEYKPVIIEAETIGESATLESYDHIRQALLTLDLDIPKEVIEGLDFTVEHMGTSEAYSYVLIRHIWTIAEAGDDLYADSGFRLMNRVGFLVTEKPWDENNYSAEYYIRLQEVLETDTEEQVSAKLEEALESSLYDYLENNFIEKGLMLDRIQEYAEKTGDEDLIDLLPDTTLKP